jgi:heme/copper-type cytochrome/quinol oxidase subunit 2
MYLIHVDLSFLLGKSLILLYIAIQSDQHWVSFFVFILLLLFKIMQSFTTMFFWCLCKKQNKTKQNKTKQNKTQMGVSAWNYIQVFNYIPFVSMSLFMPIYAFLLLL